MKNESELELKVTVIKENATVMELVCKANRR